MLFSNLFFRKRKFVFERFLVLSRLRHFAGNRERSEEAGESRIEASNIRGRPDIFFVFQRARLQVIKTVLENALHFY